jgi:hypothetical protein
MRPFRLLHVLCAALIAVPVWTSFAPVTARADVASERVRHPKPPKRPKPPKKTRGAPGPVVGMGLPFLLIAGGAAFWLVRRRPVSSTQDSTGG